MKVLFLQLVPNVGHIWEVKDVSDSYARNFLIPKWLAKKLTSTDEKNLALQQKKDQVKKRNLLENQNEILSTLEWKELVFEMTIAPNGKTFWWVNEHNIIKEIQNKFHIELDRKHIYLPNGILKKVGKYDIYIKFGEKMVKMYIKLLWQTSSQ